MDSILDSENHEKFALNKFSVETWRWVIVVKTKSVILTKDFFPLVLKSFELLTANLRIFHWYGSFHILEVINIFLKPSESGKHGFHIFFSLFQRLVLILGFLLDGNFLGIQ